MEVGKSEMISCAIEWQPSESEAAFDVWPLMSWERGGDLITLTVRVAGATVINGVIGHCRPSQINELWQYN